jgi:hypothetical protein
MRSSRAKNCKGANEPPGLRSNKWPKVAIEHAGNDLDADHNDAGPEPPPRGSRFGSPLVLSQVHWVRPEMVVEVSYAEWTPTVSFDMWSIWASARISQPSRYGRARPTRVHNIISYEPTFPDRR